MNGRITFHNWQTERTGDLSMNLKPTYRWQVFDDLKSITRPHMWDMVEVSWTRDELRANICVQVCQATFLCFETEPVGTTVDEISRQHLAWEAVKLRTKQINTKTKQLANLLLLFNLNMAAIAFFPLFGSGIINSSSTRKQNRFGINNQPLSRWRTCIVCEFSQVNMGDQNSPGDPYKCCKLYLQSWTKMLRKLDVTMSSFKIKLLRALATTNTAPLPPQKKQCWSPGGSCLTLTKRPWSGWGKGRGHSGKKSAPLGGNYNCTTDFM